MFISKNVKGYIFQHAKHGMYYLEPMKGYTHDKHAAHVYSYKEAVAAGQEIVGWGCKQSGKWFIVYE